MPLPDQMTQLDAALAAGAVVLLPNHRSAQQLQDRWSRRQMQLSGRHVLPVPAISAVDPWLASLWQQLALQLRAPELGWHVLQPAEELLLWRQVIAESPAGATLLNLDGTAASARNAWRSMQQHLITQEELRKAASQAFAGTLPDDHAVFRQWLDAFVALCRSQQLLTFGDVLQTILTWSRNDPAQMRVFLPPALMLHGFDDPPPLYAQLFAAFGTAGTAVSESGNIGDEPAMTVHEFTDIAAECRAAANWARVTLTQNPDAAIGIICPDLQSHHALLERLFRQTFPPGNGLETIAVPDLQPLSEHAFVAAAMQVLQFNEDNCDTLLLCQLLRSPWLRGADEEADARAQLEQQLRAQGEQRTSVATFRTACLQPDSAGYSPVLGNALLTLAGHRVRPQSLRPMQYWLQWFELQWSTLLDRERLPASGQTALLRAWDALLDRLRQSAFLFGNATGHSAQTLVSCTARESALPLPTGAARLQVLTPRESAGLYFTHVWCMQMNENHWPESQHPNPWLPLALQREYAMPGADPQAALTRARHILHNLIAAGSTEIVFSHAQFDKDLPLRPSRLIPSVPSFKNPGQQIPAQQRNTDDEVAQPPAALHPALQLFSFDALAAEPETVTLPFADADLRQGPGALLADQASCPFRAFAIHRLKSSELRPLCYGLPPSAVGKLVHRALEAFWTTLQSSQRLLDSTPVQIRHAITGAAGTAVRSVARRYPHTMTPRYQQVTQEHLVNLLDAWLEQERARGAFTVISNEAEMQWRFANLELRLRVDRIDRAEDGSSVVVDYKTGRVIRPDWEAPRQDKPQLLLYQSALAQGTSHGPVSAVLYARVNLEETRYTGIGANNDAFPGIAFNDQRSVMSPSWDILLQQWETSLQQLAQEFLDGYAAVQPLSKMSCTYCHLASFCRVDEMAGLR